MNDKRTTPAGGRRAKRAAPTIDLAATEVPPVVSDPMTPAAGPAPEVAPAEPVVETVASQSPPPEPPPVEPPRADAPNGGNDSWSAIRRHVTVPTLVAGFAGAVAMTLVLLVLWITGLVPIRFAGSTATRARVVALEMEVQALQKRAAPDSKSVDALTERVNAMQDAIAKLPAGNGAADPALAERIAAAETAMKALGAGLTKRNDDLAATVAQARERADAAEKAVTELRSSVQIATTATAGLSSADVEALQKRIAALEQSTKAVRDDVAKTGASDAAARLALSTSALRDAAMSGAPFAPLLTQVKALGADAALLTALEPFAASGVPSAQSLAQELRAILPGMIKTTESAAPSGGFLEKLQANASNLVKVRPVGAPAGDDAAAVLARIDHAAASADIGAALAELAKLPEATRAPAQAWIAKANARQAALSAARTLVTETARTLGAK